MLLTTQRRGWCLWQRGWASGALGSVTCHTGKDKHDVTSLHVSPRKTRPEKQSGGVAAGPEGWGQGAGYGVPVRRAARRGA